MWTLHTVCLRGRGRTSPPPLTSCGWCTRHFLPPCPPCSLPLSLSLHRLFEGGVTDEPPTRDQLRLLHQTIRKVTTETEDMRFNTGIAVMMEFVNGVTKVWGWAGEGSKRAVGRGRRNVFSI